MMWIAVHKKSGIKEYAHFFLEEMLKQNRDPHNEEWICCDDCKLPMSIVEKHSRRIGDRIIGIPPFFRHQTDERCKGGESEEHNKAKQIYVNVINNEETIFSAFDREIKIKKSDIKNVSKPEVTCVEQVRTEGDIKRRADVLIEFNQNHPVFGKGIVIEIQLSNISEEDKLHREVEWFLMGYSLTWINDVEFLDEYSIGRINITHPFIIAPVYLTLLWTSEAILNSKPIIEAEEKFEKLKYESQPLCGMQICLGTKRFCSV